MAIKAVFFDLDGTLADSLADLAEAANRATGALGFPTHATEEFKYFVGDGIPKMLERALPEGHREKATVEQCRRLFLEYYSVHYADRTRAYPGVPELVAELKKRGYLLAVVTNKAQDMADAVVTHLYGNLFDGIFGKREGVPAKPDPAMTRLAMEQYGLQPEECIMLGDSGMDIAAGVNSGAVPVGELWGFRQEDELRAAGARYILRRPEELLSVIEELNR